MVAAMTKRTNKNKVRAKGIHEIDPNDGFTFFGAFVSRWTMAGGWFGTDESNRVKTVMHVLGITV